MKSNTLKTMRCWTHGFVCVSMLFVLMACGNDNTATPTLPAPVADTTQPDATPTGDCAVDPAGSPCDDGNPCTVGDACDGQGACLATSNTVCADVDGNPCTDSVCDPEHGDPAHDFCRNVPRVDGTTEDACTATTCQGGQVVTIEPTTGNDCDTWATPEGSCTDSYVCDPKYTGDDGTSHCRPVSKVDGASCLNKGVGVKGSADAATADVSSDCLLYVCHQSDPDVPSECMLSSTLPTAVQADIEAAGGVLRHQCKLDEMPVAVSVQCNGWQCGCLNGDCTQPECQVKALASMSGKACDNGNLCDGSVCSPAKGQGAMLECAAPSNGDSPCDLFPNASCDVVQGTCDPQTGCPTVMDVAASDANCLINNLCIDKFNTKCAPNNPAADPVTGCVTIYQDAGSSCTDALQGQDACITEAVCEPKDGSMICKPTAWLECGTGDDPCNNNYCEDGVCKQNSAPGTGVVLPDNTCCPNDGFCPVADTTLSGLEKFSVVYIPAGVTVSCEGDEPLQISVMGKVWIDGVLSADGPAGKAWAIPTSVCAGHAGGDGSRGATGGATTNCETTAESEAYCVSLISPKENYTPGQACVYLAHAPGQPGFGSGGGWGGEMGIKLFGGKTGGTGGGGGASFVTSGTEGGMSSTECGLMFGGASGNTYTWSSGGGSGGGGGGFARNGQGITCDSGCGTGGTGAGGAGGSGGGLIVLTATGSVTVSGTVSARGGDGSDGAGPEGICTGGGGGGSGGVIQINTPSLMTAGGNFDVTGGAGGIDNCAALGTVVNVNGGTGGHGGDGYLDIP